MSRPSVLFVSRTRYPLPPPPLQARKWAVLGEVLEPRVLGRALRGRPARGGVFELVRPAPHPRLDGPLFYLRLPLEVARALRRRPADALVAQSPFEGLAALAGRRLARSPAPLVVELHGDWRTATTLYGSPLRRLLAPAANAAALAALRRADAVRTLSPFTTRLAREAGVEPAAAFPAFLDLSGFDAPPAPLPLRPRLLFVGVLERYKALDVLVEAWRLAAPRLPGVVLHLVGSGHERRLVERLAAELPEGVEWSPRLERREVAAALDAATALVLPSRSEGLPRIAIEALVRGRPVVGARAGGIPDLVADGENGLLVAPGAPGALAEALVRVAAEPALAARLAAGAAAARGRWLEEAARYAARHRDLLAALDYHRARP